MIATHKTSVTHRIQPSVETRVSAKRSDNAVDEIFLHELPLDRYFIALSYVIALTALTLVLGWQVGLCVGGVMATRGLVHRIRRDRAGNIPVVWNGSV